MSHLSEVFVFIAATLVTIPLIGFYLVYLISVKSTKNKLFSLKLAVDSTALLFIFSVYFIIIEIWGVNLIWLFLLFFLATAVAFTFMHWRTYEDIHIRRVIRGVWRFQFFVFFFLYFILTFLGVVTKVYALGNLT